MNAELEARLTLRIGDGVKGPWAVPRWEPLSVGRRAGSGLHLPDSWVPRGLCRFVPHELGWILQVGPRARVRVQNDYVGDHVFDRHAHVALQEGRTKVTFPELDDLLQLGIVVGEGAGRGLDELADVPDGEGTEPGTAYAAGRISMTDEQRHLLAVVFDYLIKRQPKPENVALAAAKKLGKSEQAVKKTVLKIRDRINEERWLNLKTTDQLGHYMVNLSRNLMWSDLPEDLR